MRSFLTGMVVGMLGGAAAAHYFQNGKLIPEAKAKSRQVMAHTLAAGDLLNETVGGQAGKIIRR
ncbi:MAG TPA: hypothetical protein VHQ70_02995 [Syntrophomonadaceae bacterium]|nr:hypothetical protein [Syntrophomonadaceae bacterium]